MTTIKIDDCLVSRTRARSLRPRRPHGDDPLAPSVQVTASSRQSNTGGEVEPRRRVPARRAGVETYTEDGAALCEGGGMSPFRNFTPGKVYVDPYGAETGSRAASTDSPGDLAEGASRVGAVRGVFARPNGRSLAPLGDTHRRRLQQHHPHQRSGGGQVMKCGCTEINALLCAEEQHANGLLSKPSDESGWTCPCTCHDEANRRAKRLKLKPRPQKIEEVLK
jgi:hypothetical protein